MIKIHGTRSNKGDFMSTLPLVSKDDRTFALAQVWERENRVSSEEKVIKVFLGGLPETPDGLVGEWAKVDGQTRLHNNFFCAVFKPFSKVTTDCFDQVQAYYTLTQIQRYLQSLGIDVKGAIGSAHDGKDHPIVAHVNAVEDMNAWFSFQSDDLTFGTSKDKWHLASDGDIVGHEAHHLILHHRNKNLGKWYAGEGRSIHEGFSDAGPAFFMDDPEMSEDFPPARGMPENKNVGLRTVDNSLNLDEVGHEEHSRGRVYGGFFWGLKKRLQSAIEAGMRSEVCGELNDFDIAVASCKAADVIAFIMHEHAIYYLSKSPDSVEFINAVYRSAYAFLKKFPEDAKYCASILDDIIIEGKARRMLRTEETPKEPANMASFAPIDLSQYLHDLEVRNGPSDFVLDQEVLSITGGRKSYQQYFTLPDGRSVKVLGAGISAITDENGAIVEISDMDVVPFLSRDFNRNTSVTPQKAVQRAADVARQNYLQADSARRKFDKLVTFDKKSSEEFKAVQMEYRIALEASESAKSLNLEDANLVLIPGSDDLHYEFEMGLSLYYVNARTGETMVKPDALWD